MQTHIVRGWLVAYTTSQSPFSSELGTAGQTEILVSGNCEY